MTEYVLVNAEERERLTAIEEASDPGTIRYLEALGVAEGWHCLEVGAGAGSVAQWLCRRVSPRGRVLATDIDTRLLDALANPNLEIRQHNIVTDPLPEKAFDLVHARAVLEHLPEYEQALKRMVMALKPGGWLLVEDADYVSWVPASYLNGGDARVFREVSAKVFDFLGLSGVNFFFGRHLGSVLRMHGLIDTQAEGRTFMVQGGSRTSQIWERAWVALKDRIVSAGAVSDSDAELLIALHRNPQFEWMGPVMVAAWGRKAAAETP